MTTHELRSAYLDFFKQKGHVIIPSAPLVPENDPSVLFNTAGMQPLVPYLLGKQHPMGKRLADAQKCVRTGDIDDVGDDTHLTFFEMLGNWSLGDYFKEKSISWSWEFLTDKQWLGLDPKMISVTVFKGDANAPRDEESADIWKSLGMPVEKIAYLPAEDNWWAAGPTGPCGPDTEIFYWVGNEEPLGNKGTHPKEWMEIWNNVFMQYNRIDAATLEKLPVPCVDTGMGLERATVTLGGMKSIYETDAFSDVLEAIKGIVGAERYTERSARIIADHIRSATHIISDGVVPKNVDQGYILRRLIRRAIREFYKMGYEKPIINDIAKLFIVKFEDVYNSITTNKEKILAELSREEKKFQKTLKRGLIRLNQLVEEKEQSSKFAVKYDPDFGNKSSHFINAISGKDAFDLFSTYGFPFEMIREELLKYGMFPHEDEFQEVFNDEFQKHQELSRTASAGKFKGGLADHSEKVTALHTATHLMLAGLRKELGDGVHQAGSNITEERTRFDFTHPEKVSRDILGRVEAYVNEAISKGAVVTTEIMDKAAAKEAGVEGSFWEKYPEKVTVYRVQAPDGTIYSQELCGGPHVASTKNIATFGTFKITKEEASSAGVRRVKAILKK